MEEMIFENDRLESLNDAQRTKMSQNSQANNAFKDFAKTSKDGGSPTRKHSLNKKLSDTIVNRPSKPIQGKATVTELSPQALQKNKDLHTGTQRQTSGTMNDVKDLGVVGGKKRLDQNDSQGAINMNGQKEDSFQKLYSKELDLDEDEVPIILHELNDSAIHFISHEQYERSLSLLQKAQTLLDRLKFQKNPKDRFLIQVTMHNMALCFQKMGALEECALCLDACLHQINSQYLAPTFSKHPTKKLKKLKYECKIHMQVCALLSQLHRHEEALLHAKQAVQISQYLINDLTSLCELNVQKTLVAKKKEQDVHEEQERIKIENGGMSISQTSSQADLIYYDHSISMLERTALRVFPIIKEIQNRMVKHKDVQSTTNFDIQKNDRSVGSLLNMENQPLNMKVLLGYLNQSEWLYLLNIGNIMQITPLTIHDLYSNQKIDVELSRDSILEKITFLAISYFCVSTELRFLVSSKEKLSFDPQYVKAESEFWHGKALEISCGFLPSESPLVTHILSSYQKHHAPVLQSIPENEEEDQSLRVIRPEKGIDKSQFQPIIRLNKHLNIALSPLRLSPNNHRAGKVKKVDVREASVYVDTIGNSHKKLNSVQSHYPTEDEAIIIQAANHNPTKRSIEFTENTISHETGKLNIRNEASEKSEKQFVSVGPDIVEYELQSFDQSSEANKQLTRPSQASKQPVSGRNQHQIRPQREDQRQQQTTTPNRPVGNENNKIQMAVPSPNALASAMQREQRESLSQASLNHPSQQLKKVEDAKKVQTQRQPSKHEIFLREKQQLSYQVLNQNNSHLVHDMQSESFLTHCNGSISEEELVKLADGVNPKEPLQRNRSQLIQARNDDTQNNRQQKYFEPGRQFKNSQNDVSQEKVTNTKVNTKFKAAIGEANDSDSDHGKTPISTVQQTASSQRLSASNPTAGSNRSRSKGKVNKKKPGVMTQPQTHQNSANNTAYEPLRQALQNKEISHFSAGEQKQGIHEEDQAIDRTRLSQAKHNYKDNIQSKSSNRAVSTSLENREMNNAGRPPSAGLISKVQDVGGQRPDSRRMIGGKRRQIKDQKQEAIRSNSAGRRNQNQTLHMQGYTTNDQSMTSASSHVQLTMNGNNINNSQLNPNNFKTFQQTRKAVTAHSTQASNSPRKNIPSVKLSEGENGAAKIGKVQDPVFLNNTQLNQSRSTIENNNSFLVDRSMNDQSILNNNSFEVGTRSRSFAKTGGLSQQNSRDVIVGNKKKTQAQGNPTQQNVNSSKSLSKQKGNKEMQNYLNSGTPANSQKVINALSQVQPNKYASNSANTVNNIEFDYRKQMLIKQALEIQNQTKDQQRQKQNPKGTQASGRNQINFQNHASSVQVPITQNSVGQSKQSHSSQGLRKSSHGIQKESSQANQSQKALNNQQKVQVLDPQAIAAIQQALIQSNPNNQQNAQHIFNQIIQIQQQQQQTSANKNIGQGGSKKQQINTHNMIKKFLKDRATPQPQQLVPTVQAQRNGNSLSPNPGMQISSSGVMQKHSALIDNFTQVPFLAQSTGVPQSKQAHTTKAAADNQRGFNSQKIYMQQQVVQVQTNPQPGPKPQVNSYFTEQPASSGQPLHNPNQGLGHGPGRMGAQDRFDKKQAVGVEPGTREPTPVFHHKPYQKSEEHQEAQYPMQTSKVANKQLAAMYKSIKNEAGKL